MNTGARIARATSGFVFLTVGAATSAYLGEQMALDREANTITMVEKLHTANQQLLKTVDR